MADHYSWSVPPGGMVIRNNEGQVAFTVRNESNRTRLTRFDIVCPETVAPWLKVEGKTERTLGPKVSDQVVLNLKAPPHGAGEYTCKVRAISLPPEGDPNEDFTDSQAIALTLTAAAKPVPDNGPKIPWWVFVIIGVVVVGIIGTVLYFVLRDTGLPNVVGKPVAEAEQVLQKKKVKIVRQSERSAEPEGTVIRQDPAAGTKVEENAQVTLVVSSRGPTGIAIPDVVGLTFAAASERLQSAGLRAQPGGGPTTPNAVVSSQDPRPDPRLRVAPGTTVTVFLRP